MLIWYLRSEQQIETINKDKIKDFKAIQANNDSALKAVTDRINGMSDRVNTLEEANTTLMNILDRVKNLKEAAVPEDTIVVDHPGAVAISAKKTPAKKA